MDTRLLGRSGPRVGVIGICPGDGPQREAIARRAGELGCTLIWNGRPPQGAGLVRYNLLDQNLEPHYERIEKLYSRIEREGRFVAPEEAQQAIAQLEMA